MATHEIYVGGPGRGTGAYGRSQYPAPTFNPAAAAFQAMRVSAHKGPAQFSLGRTLDFKNDHALAEYVRNLNEAGTPLAAADILNLAVIPANTLQYGLFVEVENPVTGVTLTFTLSDGTAFATAVDAGVAGTMFVPVGGAAWITDGAASLATAEFANVPKMLRATLTALPADGIGDLRVRAEMLISELISGQY